MRTFFMLVLILLMSLPLGSAMTGQSASALPLLEANNAIQFSPESNLQSSPLMFIENVGQYDDRALFQMRGGDRTIWLTHDGIWVTLWKHPPSPFLAEGGDDLPSAMLWRAAEDERQPREGANLHLTFVGSNPQARLQPFNRLEVSVNYFVGNNPAAWHSDVPVWGGVRYIDLYPGIDLIVTGLNGQLFPSLICNLPCSDVLARVRIQVEGSKTARLSHSEKGQSILVMETAAGEYSLPLLNLVGIQPSRFPPILMQDRETLELSNPFTQIVAPTNRPAATALAGQLVYSTFIGGDDGSDVGMDVFVDQEGAAYLTGSTNSPDFPVTPGAITKDVIEVWGDVFVAKVNPSGTNLEYAAILGGSKGDDGYDIDVDDQGYATLTGSTVSLDFPTTPGSYDRLCGTDGNCNNTDTSLFWDVFVAKINPSGTALSYSTFIGGEGSDQSYGIDVMQGEAYIIGNTQSINFPTTPGAMDHGGQNYGTFIVKLNSNGSNLIYSTFMPSTFCTGHGCDIEVDGAGYAYITGVAGTSYLFPFTPGAFDAVGYGFPEAYVAKLNQTGTGVVYATFLGGSEFETPWGLTLDSVGNTYIVGRTGSKDFPTSPGAYDRVCGNGGSCSDAFVVKLNPTGTDIEYGTYLGGTGAECTTFATINKDCDIAINVQGNAYITGGTSSTDFPVTPGALDSYFEGYTEAFVAKLNASGSKLEYATYLGGEDQETGHGITVDKTGMVYVTGETGSIDFPTTPGSFDPNLKHLDASAFLSKLDLNVYPSVSASIPVSGGSLVSDADHTTYIFPADTFTSTVIVTHTLRTAGSMSSTGDLVSIQHFFDVVAVYADSGLPAIPLHPFTITVQYAQDELGVAIENTLGFYTWDGIYWVLQTGGLVDPAQNTVSVQASHFSWWSVLGETLRLYLPSLTR
jgi:hypothetical protein